ncbi:L-serine ammonia-lyase, iron-sulfur-dependent, subunit beta [Oribacterium sp. C9]|uniref:L-serine ammonia-lyase, iron-sulfur-dependent subunit beta n=1 Tax=Oribacterium sp. C9 TaxID=1943579 RepID=UPI00098FEB10|nr:L-serine ammonia-lyase, iron-sulfur-dependent subunit beta [Oribacterium sp. C9]OON86674.1 L-serine ammonia-lyase, iron-sulfur-dependent, subunit beta [Oribacterium sp. C9]
MNIFNIIGPVMIGPSSSHTAGACRIGAIVNKIVDNDVLTEVRIQLSGSFARTYRGHGTDRAILAGIMGFQSYSEEIRNAMEIAEERGLKYEFIAEDIPGAHPNTARIYFTCKSGKTGFVEGASIGGGNIRVSNIDGMEVNFSGENNTLFVLHKDTPGVIANVTNLMYWRYGELNISGFHLSRKERGGDALMTLELDELPPEQLITDLKKMDNIDNALLIHAI